MAPSPHVGPVSAVRIPAESRPSASPKGKARPSTKSFVSLLGITLRSTPWQQMGVSKSERKLPIRQSLTGIDFKRGLLVKEKTVSFEQVTRGLLCDGCFIHPLTLTRAL